MIVIQKNVSMHRLGGLPQAIRNTHRVPSRPPASARLLVVCVDALRMLRERHEAALGALDGLGLPRGEEQEDLRKTLAAAKMEK